MHTLSVLQYSRTWVRQAKHTPAAQAFDKGPWPRMHGRERGQILYKLADLMEVRLIIQEWMAEASGFNVSWLQIEGLYCEFFASEAVSARWQCITMRMQENLEELAMLESLDNGKPLAASKSGDLPQVMQAAQ